ncbi:MAG: class I SAM-dependent methyltransferase [Candidatus Omnitrophica bacterium]|nr:class I SAM-dependent methyltransferase [Candidatus Omnitrophota bacterium]
MADNYQSQYIYLNEDYYSKPKEMFKCMGEKIRGVYPNHEFSVLDVGCARGEFLYYLKHLSGLKIKHIAGVDYSQGLIDSAQRFAGLKGVAFQCGKAENFQLNQKFDVITMSGVLSFFDDIHQPLLNLRNHLENNGVIFILGLFNTFDVDVRTIYRNNKYNQNFEYGYNNHSLETVKKVLDEMNMKISHIDKFHLPFDLVPQEDPIRSWTMITPEGRKFINGMGLIYDATILEIRKKDKL